MPMSIGLLGGKTLHGERIAHGVNGYAAHTQMYIVSYMQHTHKVASGVLNSFTFAYHFSFAPTSDKNSGELG
jgi:hypothetical protein